MPWTFLYPISRLVRTCLVRDITNMALHWYFTNLILPFKCYSGTYRESVHLPRPRTLRPILDSAYIGPGKPHPPKYIPRHVLPLSSPETPFTKHIRPWVGWNNLELRCQIDKECTRRGCTNRRRAVCPDCQTANYCGKKAARSCESGCLYTHVDSAVEIGERTVWYAVTRYCMPKILRSRRNLACLRFLSDSLFGRSEGLSR